MTMKPEDFDAKLRQYVTEKFIPTLSNPLSRFILGAAVGSGSLGLGMFGGPDALRAVNALDAEGMVDLDVLRKTVYAGFDATADGKLPVHRMGLALSLDRGDAERLFAYMDPPPAQPAA